jgi:hypothetical protein
MSVCKRVKGNIPLLQKCNCSSEKSEDAFPIDQFIPVAPFAVKKRLLCRINERKLEYQISAIVVKEEVRPSVPFASMHVQEWLNLRDAMIMGVER